MYVSLLGVCVSHSQSELFMLKVEALMGSIKDPEDGHAVAKVRTHSIQVSLVN
jgi:hypothetical protein